jgi:hypothetical protein
MSLEMQPHTLAKIRSISHNASAAEQFFEGFVKSIGGIKTDSARELRGARVGGADYLLRNDIVAELKIFEKDVWNDYNARMDALFSRYRESGELEATIGQERIGNDDPAVPAAMRMEWNSILLKPIKSIFREADRQIAATKRKVAPMAKGLLLLLNIRNRLHAEPVRLYWLVRDNLLRGAGFPNIDAWTYFCLPVPELMNAGINQGMFWDHFTRAENETPEGWKDQNLLLKCRGLQAQWFDFLQKQLDCPIHNIPATEVRAPKP